MAGASFPGIKMNAWQIIEAESAKEFLRKLSSNMITRYNLLRELEPHGFTKTGKPQGVRAMVKMKVGFPERRFYLVEPLPDGTGFIYYHRDFGDGDWKFQDKTQVSNMDYLMRHLRTLGVLEERRSGLK
jgi:hypothetical protein